MLQCNCEPLFGEYIIADRYAVLRRVSRKSQAAAPCAPVLPLSQRKKSILGVIYGVLLNRYVADRIKLYRTLKLNLFDQHPENILSAP